MNNLPEIEQFLPIKTPKAWLDAAVNQQDVLLIDHANCEKKAAMTALHLMHRYTSRDELLHKMSRLAREELVHFDKVLKIMRKRNITYKPLSASRYAQGLRKHVRSHDPHRLIDLLIIGAFIEARSCERFHALLPFLDEELQGFYRRLYDAEKRHFQDYLLLADCYSDEPIDTRVEFFTEVEGALIESPDETFRFHSGVPA